MSCAIGQFSLARYQIQFYLRASKVLLRKCRPINCCARPSRRDAIASSRLDRRRIFKIVSRFRSGNNRLVMLRIAVLPGTCQLVVRVGCEAVEIASASPNIDPVKKPVDYEAGNGFCSRALKLIEISLRRLRSLVTRLPPKHRSNDAGQGPRIVASGGDHHPSSRSPGTRPRRGHITARLSVPWW